MKKNKRYALSVTHAEFQFLDTLRQCDGVWRGCIFERHNPATVKSCIQKGWVVVRGKQPHPNFHLTTQGEEVWEVACSQVTLTTWHNRRYPNGNDS